MLDMAAEASVTNMPLGMVKSNTPERKPNDPKHSSKFVVLEHNTTQPVLYHRSQGTLHKLLYGVVSEECDPICCLCSGEQETNFSIELFRGEYYATCCIVLFWRTEHELFHSAASENTT